MKRQDSLPTLPLRSSKARGLAFFLLALAPLLIGALALYLGQDTNWDLRNYHWYNAYALVNGRLGFDLLPSQTPFFYNPALDVPFFLLASHVSAKVAGFILGSVQGLNVILLFMLCHATLIIPNARQKVLVCFALAMLGMLGGGGIAQIGTTFYDNITSLGLFASALMVIRFYPRLIYAPWRIALFFAFIAGLPAGVMMGFKLPFVIFTVGLCGAMLFVTGAWTRRLCIAFGFGLGVLAGLAIALGPWAWYLQEHYQSPLFPYFNDIFKSPLAPLDSGRDMQFLPTTWSDRLLFPFIFTITPWRVGEIPWRDLRLPALYVLLPLCALIRLAYGRNKHAPDRLVSFYATRYLLWLAILSYTLWLFMFAIYRYLIPLEMIAPLLIVVAMGMLPLRPAPRTLLTFYILLAIAVTIQAGDWGRKKPWLDKAISATVPPIENPSQTMILMAGFEPYSHIVPSFPPESAFVRIQSNFSSPEQGKGINAMMAERIAAHKGVFKLLIPSYQFFHAAPALGHFGLTFLPQKCQAVDDPLFDSKLVLCDVERTTNFPVQKP
ncbi:MAG: hypothetical protein WC612_05825 [Bdellovibrionales bacterium]|jgi:hypothetical protein